MAPPVAADGADSGTSTIGSPGRSVADGRLRADTAMPSWAWSVPTSGLSVSWPGDSSVPGTSDTAAWRPTTLVRFAAGISVRPPPPASCTVVRSVAAIGEPTATGFAIARYEDVFATEPARCR